MKHKNCPKLLYNKAQHKEKKMAQFTVTKRFSRKVSKDFQSWEFVTELSRSVEVNSAEDLQKESDKLFNQARSLTELDINSCSSEFSK